MALSVDGGILFWSRSEQRKVTDIACINGAVLLGMGGDVNEINAKIIETIQEHGMSDKYYTPQAGTGATLSKGMEIVGNTIRVATWSPINDFFAHFIPALKPLEIGDRSHCQAGIGGPAPLILEEIVDEGDLVLETSKPNDHWDAGPCPDQISVPNSDPSERTPPYCWVWGVDQQVLAGDGHNPNEGTVSMNGLIALDVRCQGAPGEPNKCTSKIFIPPAEEGAVNPLKGLTAGYMCAGYNGPAPIPGVYTGVHSANIAQMEGVSNAQLTQAILQCYGLGKLIITYVYPGGIVWGGNKNYDYVETIGLAVSRITYIDANTVAVIPIYPAQNLGDPSTLRDDLPKTIAELEMAGFYARPIYLPWE